MPGTKNNDKQKIYNDHNKKRIFLETKHIFNQNKIINEQEEALKQMQGCTTAKGRWRN